MTIISVLQHLTGGLACHLINEARNNRKSIPYGKGMPNYQSITRQSVNQDEKKRFFGIINSLYKNALLNDIFSINNCFYYNSSNNITFSYNSASPYLVISAFAKTGSPLQYESLKERIQSSCNESKSVFISIDKDDNAKIQLAIPASIANHTASLKGILDIVEDFVCPIEQV